ncbi:MAG: glutaredoxin family protein [Gammaproteobacteria bacterium]|nr:MAG: glutaredoxin family protein [Gammaproteobacteria bacterium]
MQEVVLYGREGCHLCEDMRAALQPWISAGHIRLRWVEIDRDPALRARYGTRIPVLCLGEREICHYHLDPVALEAALSGA